MPMSIKDIGEFGLIDLLKQNTINDPGRVITGIGDDAAVLLPTVRQLQLLTTDMLVEGVHFDLRTTTPEQLGYKAVAVSLSDIAAMGGTPRHAVISVAITQNTPVEYIVSLYKGMKEICHEYKVNIVGGDTVSSLHDLVINVAVVGEVEPACLTRRSGAKVGDVIGVTGTLGNSGCGLDLLRNGNWENYSFAWPLVTAHLTPHPQVIAGPKLAAAGLTSMNDISDGLASEVNEIANASDVGMRIYAQDVPLAAELKEASTILQKQPLDYALYGGEDYQLVFTIQPDKFELLSEGEMGVRLTRIGEVVNKAEGVVLVHEDGNTTRLEPRGYNHFR